MAEANIKPRWKVNLWRSLIFAGLNIGLTFLVIRQFSSSIVTDAPRWLAVLVAALTFILIILLTRALLPNGRVPNSAELIWSGIWSVITYWVSGALCGVNAHAQLLETMGFQGGFGFVLIAVILLWAVILNGLTISAQLLVAWEYATGLPIWLGVTGISCLAMLLTWVGTLYFPQFTFHWWQLAIYWLAGIGMTGWGLDLMGPDPL